MALEDKIAELITALNENTAAHAKLGEIATAAQASKASGDEEKAPPEEKKAAPKKAPAKKAPAKKAAPKKKAPPELKDSVTKAAIAKTAGAYLGDEELDDETREARKQNIIGAFGHLGVSKLGEITDNTDRAKLAGYIAYWMADLEVDFEAIDAIIEGEGDEEPEEDGDEEEDLLG